MVQLVAFEVQAQNLVGRAREVQDGLPLEVRTLHVHRHQLQLEALVHHVRDVLVLFRVARVEGQVGREEHVRGLLVVIVQRHLHPVVEHGQVQPRVVGHRALPIQVLVARLRHLQVIVPAVGGQRVQLIHGLRPIVAVVAVLARQAH